MNEEGPGKATRRLQQLEKSLAHCERERALVAYELHDGLVQQLAAASMLVDAAAAQLPGEPTEALKMLRSASDRLRSAIEEGRRLMRGIRPPGLELGGLTGAIHELEEELRATGLQLDLTLEIATPRLAPALETAAFRILQQALHNVQQHSGASTAKVTVRELADHLELNVRDEGVGFDPQAVPSSRYGVRGMRERAEMLGGTTEIISSPGTGTTVSAQLPLTDKILSP